MQKQVSAYVELGLVFIKLMSACGSLGLSKVPEATISSM